MFTSNLRQIWSQLAFSIGALKAVARIVDNRLMLLLSRLDCGQKHSRHTLPFLFCTVDTWRHYRKMVKSCSLPSYASRALKPLCKVVSEIAGSCDRPSPYAVEFGWINDVFSCPYYSA